MRGFARIGASVAIGALVFGVWARLLAGGPVRFIPGGWIRGEVVEEPVADWSFASGNQNLLVESRARTLPYSQRVWFMVGELMAPVVRRLMGAELVGPVRRVPGASKLKAANMDIYVLENR